MSEELQSEYIDAVEALSDFNSYSDLLKANMLVCECNPINLLEVISGLGDLDSPESIMDHFIIGKGCGTCACQAEVIIKKVLKYEKNITSD